MKLKKGSHIHLMGICGTAMASLAGLLKEKGYHVTGSDQNVYPPMSTLLESLQIPILQGYKKENLNPRPDLVIVGNVIRRDYEEAQELLKSDIPYTSLPKAMGDFVIENRQSIVLAGTHGKTTMTSMMAWVAEVCGLKPGFMVGGIPLNFNSSFQVPRGDHFVIEGDEYDTSFFDKVPKFIHYKPQLAILSGVEFDHIDIYPDIEAVKSAFKKLIEILPQEGILVVNSDSPLAMEVTKGCRARVVTYGLESGDYRAVEREVVVGRNQFCIEYKGQKIADLALKQFGAHNTSNALAVWALAREMGLNKNLTSQALADFKGVKRRQEFLGEFQGAPVIEDFAHHPTAVRLTIACMREAYPGKKLIAVFEPRSSTSRTHVFQQDYAQAFLDSDITLVKSPYDTSRIEESKRFSTQKLVEDLKSHGQLAMTFDSVEEIVDELKKITTKDHVVLIMSNGGFDGIYKKLFQ